MARSKKSNTTQKIMIASGVALLAYMAYKWTRPLQEVNPNVIVNPGPSTLEVLATGLPNIFDSLSNLFKGKKDKIPNVGYIHQLPAEPKNKPIPRFAIV